jgi:hypothetical protein
MKWILPAMATLCVACTYAPVIQNPNDADRINQTEVIDTGETQRLEQAESDCSRQGKHAVADRSGGQIAYSCADN